MGLARGVHLRLAHVSERETGIIRDYWRAEGLSTASAHVGEREIARVVK